MQNCRGIPELESKGGAGSNVMMNGFVFVNGINPLSLRNRKKKSFDLE